MFFDILNSIPAFLVVSMLRDVIGVAIQGLTELRLDILQHPILLWDFMCKVAIPTANPPRGICNGAGGVVVNLPDALSPLTHKIRLRHHLVSSNIQHPPTHVQ